MVDPTSLYPQPPAIAQPQNPVAAIGQYAEVRNALFQGQLAQQHIQQAQMATQLQNAKNKALMKLNDPKYLNPADSTLDANSWISDLAKDPETALYVPEAIATRSTLNAPTQSGINSQGQPTFQANQSVTAAYNPSTQQAPTGSPEAPPTGGGSPSTPTPPSAGTHTPTNVMSMPPGFTTPLDQSRHNYNEVTENAKAAPQMNAAYNEAINLNKAGAPTGTNIATLYSWAAKNIPGVAQGVTDKASQAQEIGKWMSQGLIANGMPGSDARLQELQHANLNPDQLPETIQELAPFFKAVSQGAIAKQNYYNKVTDNGTNLATEPHALQQWTNNFDPRWMEFNELNKKDQRVFLTNHPDLINRRQQYHNLQDMGVMK